VGLKAPMPWFGSSIYAVGTTKMGVAVVYLGERNSDAAAVLETPCGASQRRKPMTTPQSTPTLPVPQLTPEEAARFWEKVDKSAGPDRCWPWKAALSEKGYGIFGLRGKTYKAPRIAYRDHYGADPGPLSVCHNCPDGDNPACCNPAHFFLGTKAQNNADMVAKGRHVPGGTYGDEGYQRGEQHHAAKLTEDQVREMRQLYAAGGWSYARLGKRFGIGQSATYRVVKGIRWGHVV
jgi:hypothetical protein